MCDCLVSDMRPPFAKDNSGNMGLTDSNPVCNGLLTYATGCIQFSNLPDFCGGQGAIVMQFAAHPIGCSCNDIASFAIPIGGIVGMGAKEQMAGAHAGGIVALMADDQSVRDRAEMQFPRKTVSTDMLAIGKQPSIAAHSEILVEPAGACLADILPKPLFCRPAFASAHAVRIAEIGQALQHKVVTV